MPRLACHVCGKTIWATVPLAQLFAEERRCPRCGSSLDADRRVLNRRVLPRRERSDGPPVAGERRVAERRVAQRRRGAD